MLVACLTIVGTLHAEPKRAKITGVAHMGIFTKDLDNTRALFKDFFGFGEAVVMMNDETGEYRFTFIKINDDQYIELFPERSVMTNRMYHFAVETPDIESMRLYLKEKYTAPDSTPKGRTGNSNYFITDPNGTICEFVQYEPDGMTALKAGQYLPEDRISKRIDHVGFMVADLDKATSFYVDILDFKEVWRGGATADVVTSVYLQVPDGEETIELMLYDKEPTWEQMCTMTHLCLEVDDVEKTKAILDAKTLPEGCRTDGKISVDINNRRYLSYYNIDGTLIQLMEKKTVDGKEVASSTGTPLKFTE